MPQRETQGLLSIHPDYQKSLRRIGAFLLLLALIQFLAWLTPPQFGPTGIPGYLPLHALFETVSIVVAMLVFAVGWNSRSRNLPGNITLLACTFFAIGWLDFSHTISYSGMPDFYSANDTDKQLNFWLSARFLASFILLVVAIRMWTPLRSAATRYILMGGLIGITLFINWIVLFHQDSLPRTFIPGQGLTPLKKNLEYMFIGFNLITAVILLVKMRSKQSFNITNLFAAVCVMAMSEFFFTLYTTMTGGYNVLGHVYKVISYLFIYRAIVVEAVEYPYNRLAQTQLSLGLALKASNTGLWDWDLRSNDVYYSPEWKEQLGYKNDELPNNFATWESLLHPEERESAVKFAQDFVNSEQMFYEREFRLRHRNGSYRWILARGEKQLNQQGAPIRLVGSHIDITERIAATNHLRSIVEAASNAMLMVNDKGEIVLSNSETSTMFGYTKEELSGQSVSILLPDEHRLEHGAHVSSFMAHTTERRKMGVGRELFGQHKNGHRMPIEVGLSPLQNDAGQFVIATVVDITERKQQEKEALEMREQIAQATKMESVGHLTAGIAHDFNNILGAMMGYTELSQHMLAAGKHEVVNGYQAEILKAGNRAKQLISQMLTFSRISQTENTENIPTSELAMIVKEVTSLLRSSIPSTIELNYTITSQELKARIQPIHLHQILLNLGVNARDAMGEYGKIDISLSEFDADNTLCNSCNTEFSGHYAQITVKDTGSGIPEQILKKIFDPFYTTKDVGKGTGMGLSVVHGLVHKMRGHIFVESSNSGTTFNILLPLESSAATPIEASNAPQQIDIKEARIMIVDDEQSIAILLQEYLNTFGAQIFVFNDPVKALEAFMQNPDGIDLLITDETMPGMSGMLLAEKILNIKPALPIVLCTGYSEHATAESVAKIGIRGFLNKPINMAGLLQKAQVLLHKGN